MNSPTTPQHDLEAFFLPGSAGNLFSVFFPPAGDMKRRQAVLFCPPFAEEMNKARRMVALQARQLSSAGFGVLVTDLYGTGDSAGDFADARWSIWLNDLRRAAEWLKGKGFDQLILWGLRSGVLLAAELARSGGLNIERLLFWQPVAKGEQMLTQFLRLRLAADMMTAGDKITTQQLRETLYGGSAVEIAGYNIAPELARAIDQEELQSLIGAGSPPIDWFEIAATARDITPVSRTIVDAWRGSGVKVHAEAVVGETFWNSPEIAVVPELIARSSARVCSGEP